MFARHGRLEDDDDALRRGGPDAETHTLVRDFSTARPVQMAGR